MENPRQIAVRVLKRIAALEGFAEELLEQELVGVSLAAVDRGLLQELVYGIVRSRSALHWLIQQKTAGRTQQIELQILLSLGLYQMFWLDRIPDHAAVHETVQLAKELGFGPQAGFVNAVLRGYARDKERTAEQLVRLREEHPATGFSHPEWLLARWNTRWDPPAVRQLLEWNNRPAPTYARLNSLRTDAEALQAQWREEKVEFQAWESEWTGSNMVFQLLSHPSLHTLPSFQRGMFYLQDPSTLLSVQMLDPQPGEAILDLCAAPGGKTTYIAQRMNDQGYIMAQDLDIHRRQLIKENCERLGVRCVQISRATTAINPDLSKPFDRILVDAPCSNTGVMRRRVDLRWRIQPAEIPRLARLQRDLLQRTVQQLKKGGTLVYSTCSLESDENRSVVEEFLREQRDFTLETERELLPFRDHVDGAYVAKLRRRGE